MINRIANMAITVIQASAVTIGIALFVYAFMILFVL